MHCHCEICDKIMKEEFRIKHFESKFHSSLVNSIIRRYSIPNPTPNKIDDIIGNYLKIHFEKYIKFQAKFEKLLMPSNQIKYIRTQRSSYRYRLRLPNAFFFSK